jgi:hypothetical protein
MDSTSRKKKGLKALNPSTVKADPADRLDRSSRSQSLRLNTSMEKRTWEPRRAPASVLSSSAP